MIEGKVDIKHSGLDGRRLVLLAMALSLIALPTIFFKATFRDQIKVICSTGEVQRAEFIRYIPSRLEEAWFTKRSLYDSDPSKICDDLDANVEDLKSWLSYTTSSTNNSASNSTMSKFIFKAEDGNEYIRLIEPLVGHFRHPFGLSDCKPRMVDPVDVQDRSYIAFAGGQQLDRAKFPNKKYLFDLGTADFETSIGYMISKFSEVGIHFDRIWAWEAGTRTNYWDSVPENVQGTLHFYNYPISPNVKSLSHPLQILKNIYQEGDYVVLKLDIDNSDLELGIMEEIRRDASLQKMISEIMFEMHYNSRDMRQFFGEPNISYAGTLETLKQFRELGVFLHYWP